MSDPRADVALLVDFTDLRHSLCPEHAGRPPGGAAVDAASPLAEDVGTGDEHGDGPPADEPSAEQIARGLVAFAGRIGRLAVARAYADWSGCASLAQQVHAERLEPVLVPGTADGEDRSHIRLVVDALESLFAGDEPDAFVLVTGDPTLLPLVQRLRADGSEVLVVAPARTVSPELSAAADRFFPIEDVLGGVEPEPARPRTWRGGRAAGPAGDGELRLRPADRGREHGAHPTPVTPESGFDAYDWGPFVRLIDELEHRLPFVGVRYLVNKVLGPHNCGVDDPRLKRDLINRAVEDDLIEMYPVGNVGDRADPVTACRLNRRSARIVAVIGETTTPHGPPEQPSDDEPPVELD